MPDLFVVTGVIDELKNQIIQLEKALMDPPTPDDIDWEKITDLSADIEENANIIVHEADSGW